MYTSAVMLLLSSNTIYSLVIAVMTCLFTLILIANELNIKLLKKKMNKSDDVQKYTDENNNNDYAKVEELKQAPGPKPKFLIGNLDQLGGYDDPQKGFNALAEKYGQIVKLQMGSVPCMLVSGYENIKHVLVSPQLDGRPGFKRYHQLFDGDKENSLAFSDNTILQKARRQILIPHTFPKKFSMSFNRFENISQEILDTLCFDIKKESQEKLSVKPMINEICANVFTQYFATRSFDKTDEKFIQYINNFETIFWEINQGYAADFLPFLMPLHHNNQKKLRKCAEDIRHFALKHIIEDRFDQWTVGSEPNDYVESLIDHVKQNMQPNMTWETALFSLEDILGGFMATSSFITKALAYAVKYPEVQKNIQDEIDELLSNRSEKSLLLSDRNKLIHTEALIMESLRYISSPIVPHVASQDSSINGYEVKANSLIFLNNYDLNMSPEMWDEPEKFNPKRFISNGKILKPTNFIPFGFGSRSCMGYKIVQLLSFLVIGNLLKDFEITPVDKEEIKVPTGSLAIKADPYQFVFNVRN